MHVIVNFFLECFDLNHNIQTGPSSENYRLLSGGECRPSPISNNFPILSAFNLNLNPFKWLEVKPG